jgi:hypothetical protein
MRARVGALAALALTVAAPGAYARDDAAQVAGLFMQACVAHAGDAAGTRRWASGGGMHALPPRVRAAFMGETPGIAFDATNREGKFVLLSADDGGCAAVADRAEADAVFAALEGMLRAAGIAVEATQARDAKEPAVIVRTYRARGRWEIVASGVPGDPAAQAMLTLR